MYVTALKWDKYGTSVMAEWDVTANAEEPTSMVSFGAEGVVI